MTWRRNLTAVLLPALLSSLPPRSAEACAPDERPRFVVPYEPDIPLERFAAGELGVLLPTWGRSYLVVAYRYLSNVPLTSGEQQATLEYWRGAEPSTAGWERWSSAHADVTGVRADVSTDRQAGYVSYQNCGDDAFARAAKTLETYVTRYGLDGRQTRDWLEAQDIVFANCPEGPPHLPEPLPASAPAALRQDREYQIAAASFYSGQLDEAQRRFEEIAGDESSPWRAIAPYLAARAVLRRATLTTGWRSARPPEAPYDPKPWAEARARFAAVRSAARDPEIRRWADNLLRFIDLRLEPASRIAAASARVSGPLSKEEFATAFPHYRDLLFRVFGWGLEWEGSPVKWPSLPVDYTPDPADDLTSWIVAFQDPRPEGLEHALAGWTRKRTAPWLVAVLSKIPFSHPRFPEISKAARALPPDSPGALTAAWRMADLEAKAGHTSEARRIWSEYASRAEASPSARNLFLDVALRTAETLDAFAAALPRQLFSENGSPEGQRFDGNAVQILNMRVPLESLLRLLEKSPLEAEVRDRLRRTLLTRAVLLGRVNVVRALASTLVSKRAPPLEDSEWRVDAALEYLLPDSEASPFVGEPDRREWPQYEWWWCQWREPVEPITPPPFLSAAELAAAAGELETLKGVSAAGTWFCREALEFARRRPDDPRAPEYLARAVRATREACADAETEALSRKAFRRLHARYPRSPWTEKTKYWFEGRRPLLQK